jgi:hypothetical protein
MTREQLEGNEFGIVSLFIKNQISARKLRRKTGRHKIKEGNVNQDT